MKLTEEQMMLTKKMIDDIFKILRKYTCDMGIDKLMCDGRRVDFKDVEDIRKIVIDTDSKVTMNTLGDYIEPLLRRLIPSPFANEMILHKVNIPLTCMLSLHANRTKGYGLKVTPKK